MDGWVGSGWTDGRMHRWMMDSWVGDWMDGESRGDGWMGEWGGGVIPGWVPSDAGLDHSKSAWNQEAPALAVLEDAPSSGLAWSQRLEAWGDCVNLGPVNSHRSRLSPLPGS